MNYEEKSIWLISTLMSMIGLFMLDSDYEKVLFLISVMSYQVLLFWINDRNRMIDSPTELIGKAFLFADQKYKIVWYLYRNSQEIYGVKNLKTKQVCAWRKQQLFKAIETEE